MKKIPLILCGILLCLTARPQTSGYSSDDYRRILNDGYLEIASVQAQANREMADRDTASYKLRQAEILELLENCRAINCCMCVSEVNRLLDKENSLLTQKAISLGTACCGAAAGATGYLLARSGDKNGKTVCLAGAAVLAAGGLWFVVNEIRLCSVSKKINGRMRLTASPAGTKLTF